MEKPGETRMILTAFLCALIGVVAGLLSGIVGIGGGVLIVPALIYLLHYSQHKAQGTSLGALLAPIGALAFLAYYRRGNVDVKAALFIALGFMIGGYFGGLWAQHISDLVLRRVFGIVLLALGLEMVLSTFSK
jgi:uncharacterized membrane protein YfcA